ncbi:MAG: RNA-binding protein [Flavobacteriaceae bacterium]|nr:RNA-binding protein [Flavobacteriaceae bacterium]|tara:strand:- start:1227 stop:1601 length:375 start_codon:yes stop_codon:yes gene_type:complete
MRIDKFLWCLRYFKTRTQATNACKKGQVQINQRTVKSSNYIHQGDKISVRINQINYSLTILSIPKSRVGAKEVDKYRSDLTIKSDLKIKESTKYLVKNVRKKGDGRPTKKERRKLNKYLDLDNT